MSVFCASHHAPACGIGGWHPCGSCDAHANREEKKDVGFMGRIFKLIVILLILAALGVIGYAYIGDMGPKQEDRSVDVTLPELGDSSE